MSIFRSLGCIQTFLTLCLAPFLGAQSALADEFFPVSPGASAFELVDGSIRAALINSGCEEGFEAACTTVEQRSEYVDNTVNRSGDRVLYKWDIMVPAEFADTPYASLRATRFLVGENKPILYFILDVEYGYEIARKTCFGPDGYGEWHNVEMLVVWDATRKKKLSDKTPAEIHVKCDGAEVFSRKGRPNINDGDEVRIAFGLTAPISLPESGDFQVHYRNIVIERN